MQVICVDDYIVSRDRIVSITKLPPEETIAIEVEKTHTHVTNGIVTHNSTIAAGVAL
jgi:intein/homing endonuclease